MGLLDRILDFLFGKSGEARAQEIEEREPRERPSEDIIFQRKILKTGSSDKRQTRTVQLLAFTFEDNFTDRFEELAREIQRYANTHNLFIVEDISELLAGYDDQEERTDPPFIFPTIEAGEE